MEETRRTISMHLSFPNYTPLVRVQTKDDLSTLLARHLYHRSSLLQQQRYRHFQLCAPLVLGIQCLIRGMGVCQDGPLDVEFVILCSRRDRKRPRPYHAVEFSAYRSTQFVGTLARKLGRLGGESIDWLPPGSENICSPSQNMILLRRAVSHGGYERGMGARAMQGVLLL